MKEIQIMAGTKGSPQEKIKKVSIVVSKGSLEGIYPGLIMANGARIEGIEATCFLPFLAWKPS